MNKDKMVIVEWIDSSGDARWRDRTQVIADLKISQCFSVGYVLKDDEEALIICQSIDRAGVDNVDHTLIIPRVCIKSVTEVRKK